ncbi:MAG: alpha/beta hydrolase [Candidatus Obscuribacterales bacterium]|nr:alpha/beta hydrolase [Candidatus Obscuribacterales bacterium]
MQDRLTNHLRDHFSKATKFKLSLDKYFIGAAAAAVTLVPQAFAYPAVSELSAIDSSIDCPEANAVNLPVYKWMPERKARGAVVLVHGLMQNGAIVSVLARHLAEQGYLVYAIDQRGHGFWHFGTKPGEKGYRIDYKQTVKDMLKLSTFIRGENPGLPLFCIGESAGSAVCVHSVVHSPDLFNGVILCGLGTKTAPVRWKWVLSDLLRDSYRWDHMISMERYEDCYTSEDERTVVETLSDPYCRPTLSAREAIRTALLMRGMKKWAGKMPENVPILVLEGACDKIMDPKSASKFIALSRTKDKRLIMVPSSGHVLIGTSYMKPVVTRSIDNFLNTETQSAPGVDERIAVKP